MKKFNRSILGKSIFFILCIIAFFATLVSLLSALIMLETGFYTQSKDELWERIIGSVVREKSYNTAEKFVHASPDFDQNLAAAPITLPDNGNMIFEITDKNGKVFARSKSVSENASENWDYTNQFSYTRDPASQYGQETYVHISFASKDEYFVIKSRLMPTLPVQDAFRFYHAALDIAYSLKYSIYLIGFLAFLIFISTFVALMCSAGRRNEDEDLHAGIMSKLPLDLLIFMEFWIILATISVVWNGMYNRASTLQSSSLMLAGLAAAVTAPMLLGTCISIAVRLKQGTFIKNNLFYLAAKLLFAGIKKILYALIKIAKFYIRAFEGTFVLFKVTAALLAITIAEFFVIATSHRISHILTFWFLEKLILVPIILYIANSAKKLEQSATALAEGDLGHYTDTKHLIFNLKTHGENLNNIAKGVAIAVEERLRSERLKTELITNVSHDIKTPLTSIINYSDLLSKELDTDGSANKDNISEYANVLHRQSVKLKTLIDDLVEASKASTGNLDIMPSPADASLYIEQILGEYTDRMAASNLSIITTSSQSAEGALIMADSRRMWRVFDNLMNNICKYALSKTRVYLGVEADEQNVIFSFKNTSKEALNMSESEFLERFTRGDVSRSTDGNGLGLAIAKSLTELQGGKLEITTDGDLFKVTLTFPRI